MQVSCKLVRANVTERVVKQQRIDYTNVEYRTCRTLNHFSNFSAFQPAISFKCCVIYWRKTQLFEIRFP
jgi:hypothetical protein